MLQKLIDDPRPYARVKELAAKVLENVKVVDDRVRRSRMEGGAVAAVEQIDMEGEEDAVMETDEEE